MLPTPMNRKQRAVIILAVVIVGLMLLAPPWKRYGSSGGRYGNSPMAEGYGFIFSPSPRINFTNLSFHVESGNDVYIDTSRLTVQCVLAALIFGGLYAFFQDRPAKKEVTPNKEKEEVTPKKEGEFRIRGRHSR